MVRQEVYRKQGYAVQADEEQLRVQLEALQAELNAPMQFKVTGCVTWKGPMQFKVIGCVTWKGP